MQDRLLEGSAADRLIAAHDGDVALLYIYISRTGCRDTERAAGELCRTRQEIEAASEKLRRMGLLGAEKTPELTEGLPQYTAADLSRRSEEDPAFSAIIAEAKGVMGKALNSNDLRVLFGIYDYLALPPEVIFELLHFCREECGRLYGPQRAPTAKFIEQEAYRWSNREILTLEAADEYIRREKERHERTEQLKGLLGIRRDLSPTERKYIGEWTELGFEDEVILLAFDRTVTQTGGLKWAYMNKILRSWHERKLLTAEDIQAKDSRARRGAAHGQERSPVTPADLDRLLDKI